ncbi:hypothetical protein PIB30_075465, partial [Stylosanthes scabra]|nr:hypothetical protein [Stylosanthes scabra]
RKRRCDDRVSVGGSLMDEGGGRGSVEGPGCARLRDGGGSWCGSVEGPGWGWLVVVGSGWWFLSKPRVSIANEIKLRVSFEAKESLSKRCQKSDAYPSNYWAL